MTTKTAEQSFRELRELKDRWQGAAEALEEQLRGVDVDLVAIRVFEAGFHAFRGQARLLVETLVQRHRALDDPPLIPDLSLSDVTQLAEQNGIQQDFTPTRRVDI